MPSVLLGVGGSAYFPLPPKDGGECPSEMNGALLVLHAKSDPIFSEKLSVPKSPLDFETVYMGAITGDAYYAADPPQPITEFATPKSTAAKHLGKDADTIRVQIRVRNPVAALAVHALNPACCDTSIDSAALMEAMEAAKLRKHARQQDLWDTARAATFIIVGRGQGASPLCCGVFISKDLAITAAHCREAWLGSDRTVKGLRISRDEGSGVCTRVDYTFLLLDTFVSSEPFSLDLAVLRLLKVEPTATAKRAFLPLPAVPQRDRDLRGRKVRALGRSKEPNAHDAEADVAGFATRCFVTSVYKHGFFYSDAHRHVDPECCLFLVDEATGSLLGMRSEGVTIRPGRMDHIDSNVAGASPPAHEACSFVTERTAQVLSPSCSTTKVDQDLSCGLSDLSSLSAASCQGMSPWAIRLDRVEVLAALAAVH